MSVKLLFITSLYFFQPTLDSIQRLNPPCETKVVSYRNFSEIPAVYLQHIDHFDACLITGASAKKAIELALTNITKPLIAYQVGSDALHRDILQLAVEKQSLDFSRTALDFLIPIGSGCMVPDYLALEDMSLVQKRTNEWMSAVQGKTDEPVDLYILHRLRELWNQKAFDLVICQYSSIVPGLQELGIPFRCPFVSDSHLNRIINEILLKIELARHHDNHPAIIQIFPRQSQGLTESNMRMLNNKIQNFIHSNLIDCVLQDGRECSVLITSMKIIHFLTDGFQVCRIASHLKEVLDFPVAVAYGVGTNVSHAMNNVQIASKEAKLLGKSFVVDTNGNLIGPLDSAERMVIDSNAIPDCSEIARRCNLSAMTIQKLMSIVRSNGSDKIAAPELAQRLGTTTRNANRIIFNLCKGNAAKPVYTQVSYSRGRPVQVYALDFGITLV